MKVNVSFSGGLELLFNKVTKITLEFENVSAVPLKQVLATLRDKHLKEKPELFMTGESVYVFRRDEIR